MSMTRLAALAAALLVAFQSPALAGNASKRLTNFMRVHGQALPPFGFVHFCQRHHAECNDGAPVSFSRFNASPDRLRQLDRLNREINRRIAPVTDMELYGREEFWTFPTVQGDCEDYVVLKRRELMARGWPASALLITVVRDEIGEGHAVLTVRTRQGDYVLDNKVNDVRLWNRTPYKYLMRQSYLNPRLWMALDPRLRHGGHTVSGISGN